MSEVFRPPRRAMPGEIAWSGEDDAPRVCELAPLEARIRQFADANGEVVALANQIDIAIGQIELDFDFGMRSEEGRQRRHDVERREGARAGNPQQPSGLGAAIRDLELRGVNFGECRGKAAMESETGIGWACAARCAADELDADVALYRRQRPAHRLQ